MNHRGLGLGMKQSLPSWGPHPRGLIWAVRAPRAPRMLMALAAAASVPFVIVKSGDAAWEVH